MVIELIKKAESFPDRQAIISNGKSYSYKQLLTAATNVATCLLEDQKDLNEACIAFMIPPSFDYVAVQWGIWQAGGIAVPLCVLHPLEALRYVIEDTEAQTLIVSAEYKEVLTPLALEKGIRLLEVDEINSSSQQDFPAISLDRRAMILYTSGTTGKPKGVVTTHANIQAQINTLTKAWAWEKNDHILNILPLHHVHGIINVMSCALWTGACCEFLPKFNAEKVWEIFRSGRLSLFMAVPTIYFKLIDHWAKASLEEQKNMSAAFAKMRLMVSGSAALPVSVLEKWKNISGHTLLERYGMTEIGMALSNPYNGERRPGHVGFPLPGVQLRLVDVENKEVQKGEQGEIQIKGNSVFLEYWKRPDATKEAFVNGWFRTGDMAIYNDGYYKILGRNSVDIIKSGGYKISALEIEEVLRTYPGIRECAVVGIPDEEWGEVVAASLVCSESPPDFEELKAWLKTKLPAYKVPRRFMVQNELPRNTLGKVTKKVVVQLFETGES